MQLLGSREGMGGGDDGEGGGGGRRESGGGGGGGGDRPARAPAAQRPAQSKSGFDDMDDDIPF
jgi:single-strand DNA-binding protein